LICNCNHGYVSLENWNFMFYIIWMRFLLLVEQILLTFLEHPKSPLVFSCSIFSFLWSVL
jgi:hypothetical protein